MTRAKYILDLLEQDAPVSGNGGGTSGTISNGGMGKRGGASGKYKPGDKDVDHDRGNSDDTSSFPRKYPRKRKLNIVPFLSPRSRFHYTAFNKCDCDKSTKKLSAYCRKYCQKEK